MAISLVRHNLSMRFSRLSGGFRRLFADDKKPSGKLPPKPPPASATPPQDTRKKPEKTIQDVKVLLSQVMSTPVGFKKDNYHKRAELYKLLPASQEELPERTMQDSYDECLVPLSSEIKLQNRYATVKGYVRVGRILEDTDMFAVWLCIKFINNPKSAHSKITPYTIVTIRVDDISFEPVRPKVWNDLRLSGHVVWSGKTSMEARILVDFWEDDQWRPFTKAYFVMAARNAATSKGAFVNKLSPKSVFEQEQWQRALLRKKRRVADDHISLLKNPPHADEQQMIFEKYMKTLDPNSFSANLGKRLLPQGFVWIGDTIKHSELHPHPEYRNHQNTFFGGTLMRLANELAWLTAFTHSNERPSLCFISKVEFRVPVVLDSFLKFTSLVTYTEDKYLNVSVVCESTEIFTMKTTATNFFHFIFSTKQPSRQVLPTSYIEALLNVQSIRFFAYFEKEMRQSP